MQPCSLSQPTQFSGPPHLKFESSPSLSNLSRTSFFATSFEPTNGSPSFHPAFAMKMDQTSSTTTPSSAPTWRQASAYFLVCSADLRGSLKPKTRQASSNWYSLTGGGVRRISRGCCATTLECSRMAFRFFLYSSSGTCCPVELPGKLASLAPKKTVCTEAMSFVCNVR